jgi:hypothetical protein
LATGKSVVLSIKDRKMERLVVYLIVKLPPGAMLETKETPVNVNPPDRKGSPGTSTSTGAETVKRGFKFKGNASGSHGGEHCTRPPPVSSIPPGITKLYPLP